MGWGKSFSFIPSRNRIDDQEAKKDQQNHHDDVPAVRDVGEKRNRSSAEGVLHQEHVVCAGIDE